MGGGQYGRRKELRRLIENRDNVEKTAGEEKSRSWRWRWAHVKYGRNRDWWMAPSESGFVYVC